jgi:hypothetical protein
MTACLHDERSQRSGTNISPKSKSALKTLNQLAFEAKRARYPNIEPELLPPSCYKDKKANDLTKSIIAWIRLNEGQAERISTTGRPIDNTKAVTDCLGHRRLIGSVTWIPGTVTRGSADIAATIRGRSVKIEVKIDRDRQSLVQINYQKSVEAAGGIYYIARAFQSFYEWYCQTFK